MSRATELGRYRNFILTIVIVAIWAGSAGSLAGEQVWLSSLDISKMEQGREKPRVNLSVEGKPLTIAGKIFQNGIGTHADFSFFVRLDGKGERFTAMVGKDDAKNNGRPVEFKIIGDGKELWHSGPVSPGQAAKPVNVDLAGVQIVQLAAGILQDDNYRDYVDWADAKFQMKQGSPVAIDPPREEAVILTPKAPSLPRINGAKIYGCRPAHPFLFTIAASGARPITFAATGLPRDLKLDSATGIISGQVTQRGEYEILLSARNATGVSHRKLKIICGDQLALTPPMGWNSWNCFGHSVTAENVKSEAAAMVKSGLIQHGWSYINIDDDWSRDPDSGDATKKGPRRDDAGRILPNSRFPDMKAMVDSIHRLGLKAGIYSSPGPSTCGGCAASFDYEDLDAQSYGEWGVDYLKYDLCSYNFDREKKRTRSADFVKAIRFPSGNRPEKTVEEMLPYVVMRTALDKVPRDIVYSLCQYGKARVQEWGGEVGGNCWRTTFDINDSWKVVSDIGFNQSANSQFAKPGNWNDPDMLVVGYVGWAANVRPTRLTPNEQYAHISLWCLLSAPLLIGCDMTRLDDFTLNLLTNDEVLEVDQDPLGKQAARIKKTGDLEIWSKAMEDGSIAVGLFNRGPYANTITAKWSELGRTGKQTVRDLWRQKDLGVYETDFHADIPRHGAALLRIKAAR